MNINLYKFSKRENSTKQPTGTGTQFSCYLKEPTSVVSPVIVIETTSNTFPDYNYAYIATFGRYYFITDIISDGNLWTISLQTDVLATYKSAIGDTYLYVLRSAYEGDGTLVDTYYPGKSSYTIDGSSSVDYNNGATPHKATPWTTTVSSGCFILGMQSVDANMGSIKYIAMNSSNMQSLCATLASDAITGTNGFTDIINEIGQAMTKQICDPLQYIKSAMWIPLPYSTFDVTESSTLNTGYLTFSGFAYKDITGYFWTGGLLAFSLPSHPQVSRGVYLNDKPFTERYLFAPPFGLLNINNNNIVGLSYIAVNYRLDMITGMGDVTVYGTNDPQTSNVHLTENAICRNSGQVGVPITMTQATHDYLGMITGVATAAEGMLLGSTEITAGGIGNTLGSLQPRTSSMGGTGGIAGLGGTWRLYSIFTAVPDDHPEDAGKPLCKVRKPSAIPGYILARHGDVPISGTAGEQAEIQRYLEGGFFYE